MKDEKIAFKVVLKYNTYFWCVWLIFYSLIFYRNIPNMPYFGAVLSSILITIPLFSLSLIIWPVIRWLQLIRISRFSLVILHFLLANIYTIIWLSVYYGILLLIFGDQLYSFFNVSETIGWQYPSGITFYLMVSGAYYSIIYYKEIKFKEISESKLQLMLKETQFKALREQLNPHFLFNSLNSINALIKSDPENARSMLVKLSDLLRLSLNSQNSSFVPLDKELEFAHTYLDIEKIRFADRLEYTEAIADNLQDIEIPSMIIQPLLENAIKHGIASSSKKGNVKLQISKKADILIIEITNSIAATHDSIKDSDISVNGVGLKNLDERFKMLFDTEYSLSYGKISDNTFSVKISIPFTAYENKL